MRLSDWEIGRLNLKEFDALCRRKRLADNQARLNVGFIAAAVNNCAPFGDPNRRAVSPLDYVPDWKPEYVNDLREMTPEEQKSYMHGMFFKKAD